MLGRAVAGVSRGREAGTCWGRYGEVGVTAIYAHGIRLVAVAVDAMDGPLLRFRDVQLIARAPSQVRAELDRLAHQGRSRGPGQLER